VVDAAAAGIISGVEAIRYSATLAGDGLVTAAADALQVVITDTNRDRAHHWRSSQDVHGHTEPGGPETDVLTPTNADQRLEVFAGHDPDQQTIAVQEGPVAATATSYGEPFAYRPEDRAVMAVDGDPATAWLVGDHGDPIGERIELAVDGPVSSSTVRQPAPRPGGRAIRRVILRVDGIEIGDVDLGPASWTDAGQRLAIATTGPATVSIEIAEVDLGDTAVRASRAGVGFVEIDFGLGPTTEWVRPPVDAVDAASGQPLSVVLTRLRVGALDPWRSDPEPELHRVIELPDDRAIEPEVTLRLDPQADDVTLAGILAPGSADHVSIASARLTGAPHRAGLFATDGDRSTAWTTPYDGALGASLTVPLSDVLEGSFDLIQLPGPYSVVSSLELIDEEGAIVVAVPPPDQGGRSVVSLPRAVRGDTVTLRITDIAAETTIDRRYGDRVVLPASIAEVAAPGVATASIDPATQVVAACRADLLTVDGTPSPLSFSTTVAELLAGAPVAATVCDAPLDLEGGEHRVRSMARHAGYTLDRLVLSDAGPTDVADQPVGVLIERDDTRDRTVLVDPCPTGCWVVLGEGFSEAWEATADGTDLGPPQIVDGGFNGWWLPPTTSATAVEFRWTAQRPVTLGLAVSLASIVACLLIVALTRRRGPPTPRMPTPVRIGGPARSAPELHRGWVVPMSLLIVGGLLIQPVWGLVGGALGIAALLLARVVPLGVGTLLGSMGLGLVAFVALAVMWIERRDLPSPDAGWTESFARLNGAAVLAVVCVAIGALATPRPADSVRFSCAP
ncbi:MAG: hypothetical protein QNM02_09135, partial [Acidimicrobiia bacterium]|nr:hypothetical protein [Acidimicrobiia bacterium]